MTDPLQVVQGLIDTKHSVYAAMGVASSVRGRMYFVIWGYPSNRILVKGYGDTVVDAARDALSQLSPADAPQPTGLPGLTTRPALPGMTR